MTEYQYRSDDETNNKDKKSHKKIVVISVSCLLGGTLIGTGFGYLIAKKSFGLSYEEKKIIEGYRLMKENWLFGNEDEELSSQAMKGVINSVANENGDSYTFYTDTESQQGLQTDGTGFGFSSHSYDGNLYVTQVHLSAPATNLLKAGDVISAVTRGNESTYVFKEHSASEINAYLAEKSATGTDYVFQVQRGSETLNVTMRKSSYQQRLIDIVKTPTAENGNTLIVKINTFLGDPTSALVGTLEQYKDKTSRLVFDLRGNGGGLVSQSESMASLFVRKNTLIDKLVDKNGKQISAYYQKDNPKYSFDKYGLIIDSNSASATESFVLAMRAGTDNCTIYGLKSYGKGIAQNLHYFDDGSVIRYTSAYVYGPSHSTSIFAEDTVCIHGVGIEPDDVYSTDYVFLNSVADYTGSLGISLTGQNFFLKALSLMYPSSFINSYSANYHFVDAVKQYAEELNSKYTDEDFGNGFSDDGTVSKVLNDRFTKECYDTYLDYYQKLTEYVDGK